MDFLFSLITKFLERGEVTEQASLFILFLIFGVAYWKYFKPLKERVDAMPISRELKCVNNTEVLSGISVDLCEIKKIEDQNFKDLTKEFQNVLEKLHMVHDFNTTIMKDIPEQLKQIDKNVQHLETLENTLINMQSIITKVADILDGLDDLDKDTNKEVQNLREDVDKIKQILNQFQGHLMYRGSRSNDFGNKELK